jgi:hypothetical protein
MTTPKDPTTAGPLTMLDMEKFRDCVLLSITIRTWGNRAKVTDLVKLEAFIEQLRKEKEAMGDEAAKAAARNNGPAAIVTSDRVKNNVVLVKSDNLDKLKRELTEAKAWCLERSRPSMFRPGLFLLNKEVVPMIHAELKKRKDEITKGALATFLAGYPTDVDNARTAPLTKGGLGPLWNEKDYPTPEKIAKAFELDWYFLNLGVPENIPDDIKAEAQDKFKQRLASAAEQIEDALRVEFLELIEHAQERLTVAPGEKPKVFRESMIGNLVQFCQTFDFKNVFKDEQLAGIIDKTKQVLLDEQGNAKVTPEKLRTFASVRADAKAKFGEIKGALETMIEQKKSRRFEFETEEA